MLLNITPLANWSKIANANLEPSEIKALYKKLITEEYNELLKEHSGTPEEYNECCDLLWVTILYCISQGYDINKGLEALIKSNSTKFYDNNGNFNPQYRKDGKLLKGNGYVKANWYTLFNTLQD